MAMRRIWTRGIDQANKFMLGAAIAYNLKKWLNYKGKDSISKSAKALVTFEKLKHRVGFYCLLKLLPESMNGVKRNNLIITGVAGPPLSYSASIRLLLTRRISPRFSLYLF